MKKKRWFTMIGSICLTLVLALLLLPACAPATPEEAVEEIAALEAEIDDLEGDVAAEKAKAKKLQDEIAALRKPAEVQKWEPSCWAPAGVLWDDLVYICDYITRMSDGRIVATAATPGAICPVDETLEAVASGVTEAMEIGVGYYGGKSPVFAITEGACGVIRTASNMNWLSEVYEGGRIRELINLEFMEYGDVHIVGSHYIEGGDCLLSNVPIYGIDDLKGVKFRSAALISKALAELGAGTVWFPGDEIYTSLATGVIDACSYSNPPDMVDMSMHEVTKYWISKPVVYGPSDNPFIVNGAVWQELPDDLKAVVEGALHAGVKRGLFAAGMRHVEAWAFVKDYGIEIIEWSDEDVLAWGETYRKLLEEIPTDAESQEVFDILESFMLMLGYWE